MSQTNKASQGLEKMIVDNAARVRFEDLPRNVVEYCKLLVMDSFGVTFPGSTAPGCREVVELARAWGGTGSHVLLYGYEAAPPFVVAPTAQ